MVVFKHHINVLKPEVPSMVNTPLSIFFFFLLGFYSTTAPEGIKISRVSDTAEEFLRHICILTLNLVLLKYQTILI